MQNYLQRVPEWVVLFWWWRPLGHLWCPTLFFDTKSVSKVLHLEPLLVERAPKWSQNGAQMVPT